MRSSPVILLPLVLVFAVLTAEVHADGVVRDGIGAISTGRGGTNIGFADNAAIILDNPAAMTNVPGCGFTELGIDTVICDLSYSDLDNDADGEVKGFPSPMIGYVRRAPCSPLAWGLGFYVPAGFSAEFDLVNPHFGQTRYKSLGVLGKVLPGVAYQVTDRLSVGATLGVAIGQAELEAPFYVQTGPLAGAPTLLDLQATDATPTGGVGLQYQLSPSTTLGVAYTEESRFVFDGHSRVTLLTPLGPLGSDFDTQLDLVWPRSLGVGIKHELCCCRRIGVDVIWYDWSHAFDQLDLVFRNPTNPVVAAVVGPEVRDAFPVRWDDSVSLRIGYEWDASDVTTWRVGYVYHDSPVPNETLTPLLDGVLEHAFSAGVTRDYGRASLNLAYQYSFGPERQVGVSDVVGGDFDNSTFEAEAHWISFSFLFPY
jgi:long-chain fatty acid transport protein